MGVTCPCGVPVPDGYLCHPCTGTLRETVRRAPLWADQLFFVTARLTRYAEPVGRRGASAPLPYNPAGSDTARVLDGVLRAAVAALAGCDGAAEVRTARLGVVASWLAAHVEDLRLLPSAAHHERVITHAVDRATIVSDRPPEQWYAGKCPACNRDLYPTVDAPVVECPCGAASFRAEDRRAELLEKVRGVEAPGPDIARALSTFTTRPLTQDRLRQWRHRGKLTPTKMTTHPATNWYRVGDVLDLLARERC